MPALSAHLREPDDHARLGFHPGCPICASERLSGTLTSSALVSQRTRAALTAGVLVVTTVGPAAAYAAEPVQERIGTADPGPPAAGDSAQNPDMVPDGTGADGANAVDDDSAPVDEPDPNTDVVIVDDDDGLVDDAPIVDDGHGPDSPGDQAGPAAPPTQPQPPPSAPAAPTAPSTPPATATTQPASPATTVEPVLPPEPSAASNRRAGPSAARTMVVRAPRQKRRSPTATRTPAVTPTASVSTAPTPTPAPAAGAPPVTKPGDRTHTVRPGESLWSIADDALGSAATPARIAREVHRLWELNKDRIATGDPDLLMIDTRLKLR